MIKNLKLGALLLVWSTFSHGVIEEEGSFVDAIKEENLKTLPYIDEDWDAHTFGEYLEKHMKHRLNPSLKRKRRIAFQFFKALEEQEKFNKESVIDDIRTCQDLSLLCGQGDKKRYVGSAIDRTHTEHGRTLLQLMLSSPITHVEELKKRQRLISLLVEENNLLEQIRGIGSRLQKTEVAVMSFWDKVRFENTAKMCYYSFPGTDVLNDNEEMLLLQRISDHSKRGYFIACQAIASGVLFAYGVHGIFNQGASNPSLESWANDYKSSAGPAIPLLWRFVESPAFRIGLALGGGILNALSLKESYEWFRDNFILDNCLHELMNQVSGHMKEVESLYHVVKNNPRLSVMEQVQPLINFFEKEVVQSEDFKELLELLHAKTFDCQPSWFSHKGVIFKAYRFWQRVKREYEKVLANVALIDVYASLATWYNEHQNSRVPVCFAQYASAETPFTIVENFWHPLIDEEVVVLNSLTLGTDGHRPHALISGPNAGGKSVVLKSLAVSIILAQTFGLVPASKMEFTPFSLISTYLNIADDIGAGNSLFKAEVLRAQELFQKIETSQKNQFCFAIFDEVFNGTSPVEGAAAAYAVAKGLSECSSALCLIASHFPLMTNLERDTTTFTNYKVSVVEREDQLIEYPYKLEQGSSHQNVALKILRNQGFSGPLIDVAEKMIENR